MEGSVGNATRVKDAMAAMAARTRWRVGEIVFWIAAAATFFLLPGKHLILTEIAIIALFALSVDLLLGYAGIVSLGHAAFFGVGAYAAGLLAKHGFGDPLLGLAFGAAIAALLGFVSSFLILRGTDLTRLMVTLGVSQLLYEIANKARFTGGADGLQGVVMGPILGVFEFDIFGKVGYAYSLIVLFVAFLFARRFVGSSFGLSLLAIKNNPLRARAVGAPVDRRIIGVYTLAALYAGLAGALLAQTQAFVSLDVFAFHRSADGLLVLLIGGAGYLYGGIVGAVIFKLMQDQIAALTPQYWQFWIGLFLVALVVIGRDRLVEGPMGFIRSLWRRR